MGSICLTSPKPGSHVGLQVLRNNFGAVFALTSGEYEFQFNVLKTNGMLGYFDDILTPRSDTPKGLLKQFSHYYLIDDKPATAISVSEKIKFLGISDVPLSSMYTDSQLMYFENLTFLRAEEYTEDHILEQKQLFVDFGESVVAMAARG
jgi:hypothetical protein